MQIHAEMGLAFSTLHPRGACSLCMALADVWRDILWLRNSFHTRALLTDDKNKGNGRVWNVRSPE